jgi:epoxyqueuosine reductase
MPPADPSSIVRQIKDKARSLGFDLCGIASPDPSARQDFFQNWIRTGQHGQMKYMADRARERLDVKAYFPPARSVVCVAMNYHVRAQIHEAAVPSARIARYARADDYHDHIKDRLYDLADWIRDTFAGTQTKVGVDTVPVMERELAVRAGIGWQGKNTCVIDPTIGSWLFLAEVITSLELPADTPHTDHCGTCRRCIDACPTAAITAPYQLDATRCISYLTIEHDGEIDPSLKARMGDWVFGCDICQDVCPFNSRAPDATDPHLVPRLPETLDAESVTNWTLDEYHTTTRRTAMRRVKLPLFQRNANIAIGNQK